MSDIRIEYTGNIEANITLPNSKSISNRVLLMEALATKPSVFSQLSNSDDTQILLKALNSDSHRVDIGMAGTACRFMTAYLACRTEKEVILHGHRRMHERPIGILVDALRTLGADIVYLSEVGCLPLRIRKGAMHGGVIELRSDVSSQYLSALLMIAPVLEGGLELRLIGEQRSMSYVQMTLSLLRKFGVNSFCTADCIRVPQQNYQSIAYTVEKDWSSAAFWYQLAALDPSARIRLYGMVSESCQGDIQVIELFRSLGVNTSFDSEGLILEHHLTSVTPHFVCDFTLIPDLAQSVLVTCVLKEIPFHVTGLHTLYIKETDRVKALQCELKKLGAQIEENALGELSWDGKLYNKQEKPCISSYDDHRMAMAFAPAASLYPIVIKDSGVVSKSYPHFWEDFKASGFMIEEM